MAQRRAPAIQFVTIYPTEHEVQAHWKHACRDEAYLIPTENTHRAIHLTGGLSCDMLWVTCYRYQLKSFNIGGAEYVPFALRQGMKRRSGQLHPGTPKNVLYLKRAEDI